MSGICVPAGNMYRRILLVTSSCGRLTAQRTPSKSCSSVANVTPDKKYYDVVIAGGGMVGCAMACKLCKWRICDHGTVSVRSRPAGAIRFPLVFHKFFIINNCVSLCILAREPALRGVSVLLLEGGPRKEYSLDAKKPIPDKTYSNRVSAVSKSSVQLLQSVGAWQIIEDLGGCNAVKEMRVSAL